MTSSNGNGLVTLGMAVDNGSGYGAIGFMEGGRYTAVESPEGRQTQNVLYQDPKTGKWYFGRDALLHSYTDTSDNLFMHYKRAFFDKPNEPIFGGRHTPAFLMGKSANRLLELAYAVRPDIKERLEAGAADIRVYFTIPARWGLEQTSYYERAIRAAGYKGPIEFVAEPIAAARRVAMYSGRELHPGHRIAVFDIGAGTFDIGYLQVRSDNGSLEQMTHSAGNMHFAGHDLTNALAKFLAETHRVAWRGVYGKGGLNLTTVPPKKRRVVLNIWEAAEEAKKKLSVSDEATVILELNRGPRKTVTIDRIKARELWKVPFATFRSAIEESIAITKRDPKEFQHVMLVGGSSVVPGLRDILAHVLGCDVRDVLVDGASDHCIAAGAAQAALYQDAGQASLESGFGLTVVSADGNAKRNILFVPPGSMIPSDGLLVSRQGFGIDTRHGRKHVTLEPFIVRSGRATGSELTDLPDDQILRLEPVTAALEHFPEDDHEVRLGLKITSGRRVFVIIHSMTNPQSEGVSVALAVKEGSTSAATHNTARALDIVLVLDVSGSMYGQKLIGLRDGALKFCTQALANGARIGIVVFGAKVELILPLTTDRKALEQTLMGLEADGGTPMREGFQLAEKEIGKSSQGEAVAVVFSDGMPNSDPLEAATRLKQHARVISVGIGEDVDASFLRKVSTSPADYTFANADAESIVGSFQKVARLIYRSSGGDEEGNGSPMKKTTPRPEGDANAPSPEDSAKKEQPKQEKKPETPEDLYEDDWEEI